MSAAHCSDSVRVIVHVKNLLLLCCQVLMSTLPLTIWVLLPIHYSKSHGTWHEYVALVASSAVWALDVVLRVSTLLKRLEVLNLLILL